MARRRLSKLQKWILQRTFEKIINEDNSNLTLLQSYSYRNGKLDNHYWRYLFRAEILLDYFKCEPNNSRYCFQRQQHFSGNNNKAQVSVTNTLKNLRDKGLIVWMVGTHSRWQGIFFTKKGLLLTVRKFYPTVNINESLLILSEKFPDQVNCF